MDALGVCRPGGLDDHQVGLVFTIQFFKRGDQVGGKRLISCDPSWSTEQWHFWGVEEFPDIQAVMKHTKLLADLKWERYVETITVLGTKV